MGHTVQQSAGSKELESDCCSGGMMCTSNVCCPSVSAGGCKTELRLNGHCDFSGHCVQLRNTFIHIECGADGEDEDCVICGRRRAKSADDHMASRAQTEGSVSSCANSQQPQHVGDIGRAVAGAQGSGEGQTAVLVADVDKQAASN